MRSEFAIEVAQKLVKRLVSEKPQQSSFSDGGATTMSLSDNSYEAAMDVASVLELIAELCCKQVPDEMLPLTSEAMSGWYNVLMMAKGQITGLAEEVFDARRLKIQEANTKEAQPGT